MDQFIKHELKIKYYLRYCDDFVIVENDINKLQNLVLKIENFLNCQLKLELHQNKIIIRKLGQGIDFLGYVILPHYLVLRTRTKKRMFKRINTQNFSSYSGLLTHCSGHKIICQINKKVKS